MSRAGAMRLAALSCGALLAGGLLAGCGGSSSTASSPSTTPSTTAASTSGEPIAGALAVTDPWVKATDSELTGAFAVISNPQPGDVTIVSASSPVAGMVELHETVMKDGAMVMQPKEGGFVVPGGGTLELKPGGNHIMLMKLSAEIKPGEEVPVTLTLSNGGTVELTAIAKEFTGAQESYVPSPGAEGGMESGGMESGGMGTDMSSPSS